MSPARPSRPPTFSVVAPVFNEHESLPEFVRRTTAVLTKIGEPWEIVVVDDGSTDGSTQILEDLARRDAHIRQVIFSRNFGHQIAATAGLDHCRGRAAIIIDADLQDPPELLPELIARWREGYQVVYAVRTERAGKSWFKTAMASLFYRIIYRITDVRIPLDTGDFRLLDRRVHRRPERDPRAASLPPRNVGLGRLLANRRSLQAGGTLRRRDEVSAA